MSVLEEAVDRLIGIGKAVASAIASAASSVTLTVRGNEDADDGDEQLEGCETWGTPAVLWRPADPDASGSCEVMFQRRGDEIVGFAYKDRRWQVSVEKGEVVVRAFGSSAAKIKLKPDGTIELGLGATEKAILGDAFMTLYNAHTHSTGTGPSGPPAVLMSAAELSTKVKVGP